jgi:hypothetical protein
MDEFNYQYTLSNASPLNGGTVIVPLNRGPMIAVNVAFSA